MVICATLVIFLLGITVYRDSWHPKEFIKLIRQDQEYQDARKKNDRTIIEQELNIYFKLCISDPFNRLDSEDCKTYTAELRELLEKDFPSVEQKKHSS